MNIFSMAGTGGPALAVHGGAGPRPDPLSPEAEQAYRAGLERAVRAGRSVLLAGWSALDAVCAAVVCLEDDEQFNSAHGAALTSAGTAELDAAVMQGSGAAGSVAACRTVRNPVLAARAVMERTRHVLMVSPGPDLLAQWNIDTVENSYFITQRRREELARVRDGGSGTRHGTVGAVALDSSGHVAAATSTGGVAGQLPGRVGDTPVVGAGTFASDDAAAISCTGEGEYFLRGVVAHDVCARMSYQGLDLESAVRATLAQALEATGGSGGLIAVGADGAVTLAFNSTGMFRGYWAGGDVVTAI